MTQTPLQHVVVTIADTPFHAFISDEDGAIRASGFATENDPEAAELCARLARQDPVTAARGVSRTLTTHGEVHDALEAFAAGEVGAIDGLTVTQRGTPFRSAVWQALRSVPAGSPVSYTELAARAGRPSAVRAAASGCATNLVALVVPCHRIVRTDGGLGGYLFGTELKRRLLEHESAALR